MNIDKETKDKLFIDKSVEVLETIQPVLNDTYIEQVDIVDPNKSEGYRVISETIINHEDIHNISSNNPNSIPTSRERLDNTNNIINNNSNNLDSNVDSNTNTNSDIDNINNKSNVSNTEYKRLEEYPRLVDMRTVDSQTKAEWMKKAGATHKGNARKRKAASELLEAMLTRDISQENIDEILGDGQEVLGKDHTAYNVMLAKMIQQAMAGDVKAFLAIRDTCGDKPVDKQELVQTVLTDKDRSAIDRMVKKLTG